MRLGARREKGKASHLASIAPDGQWYQEGQERLGVTKKHIALDGHMFWTTLEEVRCDIT